MSPFLLNPVMSDPEGEEGKKTSGWWRWWRCSIHRQRPSISLSLSLYPFMAVDGGGGVGGGGWPRNERAPRFSPPSPVTAAGFP